MRSNFSQIYYIIAPFICFILGYILCTLFFANKTVQTPDLVGKSLHDAITLTSKMHINLQLIGEKECPGIKPGNIVTQKPVAGRLMKSSQSILVITSKPSTTIAAPNITKLSMQQAELMCKEQQIKLKTYLQSYHLPAGICIGQSPTAQEDVPHKKMVAYYAKESPKIYLMPNLIGKQLGEVSHFLKIHNIDTNVFNNDEEQSAPFQETLIIVNQQPISGSLINLDKKMIVQLAVA